MGIAFLVITMEIDAALGRSIEIQARFLDGAECTLL